MQVQQQTQQQFDFIQMEADIQELKYSLLESLRIENPEAYQGFLKELNVEGATK